jgi:Domain of unknown function (DUF1906)
VKVVDIPPGAMGADMLTPLSPSVAFALYSFVLPGTRTQLTFIVRYLENLTASELAGDLASGLGVALVSESRANGWLPNAGEGSADALRAVTKARALGVDPGMVLFCDLEGMSGTAQDTTDYCIAWCDVVSRAGYIPGAYIGDSVPLTAQQLYLLPFQRYWHSLSMVQNVATAGYTMFQGFPTMNLGLSTGALAVDLDVVFRDYKGRVPTMLVAS